MTTTGVPACNALTGRWARSTVDGGSTVISGAALWPLLGYLAAGTADGSVERAELETALGLPAAQATAAATGIVADLAASADIGVGIGI